MSSTDVGVGVEGNAGVEEAGGPDPDAPARALLAELTAQLGTVSVAESHVQRGDLWVRVRPGDWKLTALACRDLGFDYFCFLSGLDWMPSTSPNPRASVSDSIEGLDGEGVEDEQEAPATEAMADVTTDGEAPDVTDGWQTGYAGGDTRFQVFARLYSIGRHQGITLKADLDNDSPSVDSIIDIYPGADWSERETWEMYGFDFIGHPHLVHLYLPGEFEGFPQRKDFPLLSREVKPWPGLVDVEPMPEVPEEPGNEPERVIAGTTEIATQAPVTAAAGGTTVTETADDAPDSDLPEGTVAVGDSAVAESNVRERLDPEPPTVFPTPNTPAAEPQAEPPGSEGTGY